MVGFLKIQSAFRRWRRSDVLAARAQLGQDDVDAVLVDRAQPGVGQPQAHPAVLALDPELATLQVRHEPPPGPVVSVGNVVAHHRGFPRYYTNASHGLLRCFRSRPEVHASAGNEKGIESNRKAPLIQALPSDLCAVSGRVATCWSFLSAASLRSSV